MKKKILIVLMVASLMCPPRARSQSHSLAPLINSLYLSASEVYNDTKNHLRTQKEQHFNLMRAVLGYGLMSENALRFFEKNPPSLSIQDLAPEEAPSHTTFDDDPTRISSSSHHPDQESPNLDATGHLIENEQTQEEKDQIQEVEFQIQDFENEQKVLKERYDNINTKKKEILAIIDQAKEEKAPSSFLKTYNEAQRKIQEDAAQDNEISNYIDNLTLLLKKIEESQGAIEESQGAIEESQGAIEESQGAIEEKNKDLKDFESETKEFWKSYKDQAEDKFNKPSLKKDNLPALEDTEEKKKIEKEIEKRQKELEKNLKYAQEDLKYAQEDLKYAQKTHKENLKNLTSLFHNFLTIQKVSSLIEKDPNKNDLQDEHKLIENVKHTIQLVQNHQKLQETFEKAEKMQEKINALVSTLGTAFLEEDLKIAFETIPEKEDGFSKMKTLFSSCLSQNPPIPLSQFCSKYQNIINNKIKELEELETLKESMDNPSEKNFLSSTDNFMKQNAPKVSLPEPVVLGKDQLTKVRNKYNEIETWIQIIENSDLQNDLMKALPSFNESDVEENLQNINKVQDTINKYSLLRQEEIQNLGTRMQSYLQSFHASSASSPVSGPSNQNVQISQSPSHHHATEPSSTTPKNNLYFSHLPKDLKSELQKRSQQFESTIEAYRQTQESTPQLIEKITQELNPQIMSIHNSLNDITQDQTNVQDEGKTLRTKTEENTAENQDRGTTTSIETNYSSPKSSATLDLDNLSNDGESSDHEHYGREDDNNFYNTEKEFNFEEQEKEPKFNNVTSSETSLHDDEALDDSLHVEMKNAQSYFEQQNKQQEALKKKEEELNTNKIQILEIQKAYENFIATAKASLTITEKDSFAIIKKREKNIKEAFDYLTKILGISQEHFSPENANHMPSTDPADHDVHRLSSELNKPEKAPRRRSQSLPSRSSPAFHLSYSNQDYEEAMASLKRIGEMVGHMNQSLRATLEKHTSKLQGGKVIKPDTSHIKPDASNLPSSPAHTAETRPPVPLNGQTAYKQAMKSLDRMSHTIQSMITSLTAQTKKILPSHKASLAKTNRFKKESPQPKNPAKDSHLENSSTNGSQPPVENKDISAKLTENKDISKESMENKGLPTTL